MRYRPQLSDPSKVHDVRPVNAKESAGIEHGLDAVHGHVQQVGCRACVQADVVLEGFNPIDLSTGTKIVRSPDRTANRSSCRGGFATASSIVRTCRVASSPLFLHC